MQMKNDHMFWGVFGVWLLILFACNCAGITGNYTYGNTTLTTCDNEHVCDGKVISTQDGGEL